MRAFLFSLTETRCSIARERSVLFEDSVACQPKIPVTMITGTNAINNDPTINFVLIFIFPIPAKFFLHR